MKARYWIPASTILLAGAAAVMVRKPVPQKPVPVDPHGLRVPLVLMQKDGSWQVQWDHNSSLIQTAASGSLLIRDGPRSTQIRLTQPQLKEGNVAYVGLFEPVHFDLEVYGANPQALLPPALPPPAPIEQAPQTPLPMHAARRKRPRSAIKKPRTKMHSTRRFRHRR